MPTPGLLAPLLLLAAVAPAASARSSVELRFEGSVLVVAGPLATPFDAVGPGDPVTIVFEVAAPGVAAGTAFVYDVLPASVAVDVGGAVDTIAPGASAAITVRVEPGVTSLTGRVPLASGLEIDHLLHDLEPLVVFPSNDLTQLFGTHAGTDIDFPLLTLLDGATGIQIELATLTIGPGGGAGSPYCGPAAQNSTGRSGALGALGSASVADNDLVLSATALPDNVFGMFLVSREQAFVPNPGGSAVALCLGGSIGRFTGPGQIQLSGASGEIDLPLDWAAIPQADGFVQGAAGETWSFQLWYRDLVAGVPVPNCTNGVSVTLR